MYLSIAVCCGTKWIPTENGFSPSEAPSCNFPGAEKKKNCIFSIHVLILEASNCRKCRFQQKVYRFFSDVFRREFPLFFRFLQRKIIVHLRVQENENNIQRAFPLHWMFPHGSISAAFPKTSGNQERGNGKCNHLSAKVLCPRERGSFIIH